MKFILSFAIVLLFNVLSAVDAASATSTKVVKPVVVFNNGHDEPDKTCSTSEWDLVVQTVGSFSDEGTKRQGLRFGSRRLYMCRNCGSYCLFLGVGCPVRRTNRRMEESSEASNADERGLKRIFKRKVLSPLQKCNSAIPKLHAALDALQVSSTCAALVASRDVWCSEITDECEVTNVSLEGDVQIMHMPTTSTTSFCQSKNVTFGADAGFFRGHVTFSLATVPVDAATTASVEAHSYDAWPYYFLGTDANQQKVTTQLAAGNYTLTVTSDYTPDVSTTVPIRVVDC